METIDRNYKNDGATIRDIFSRLLKSPRVLIAMLLISPLHTASPHIYNWYLTHFVNCRESSCSIEVNIGILSFELARSAFLLFVFAFSAMALRSILWATFEVKGAELMQDFFDLVINKLKNIKATWFDENPSGKIINRLFGDFHNLQHRIIVSISDGSVCFMEIVSCMLISAYVNPWIILPYALIWTIVLLCQVTINPAFEHVSSVSSKKKSSVIAVLSDIIEGAHVYRSYQKEEHILARLKKRTEEWISVEYFQWRLMTWAWVWMWLLAESALIIVIIITAWAFQKGEIEVALAGVILAAAGQQQNMIGWALDCLGQFLTAQGKARRFLKLSQLDNEDIDEHKKRVIPNHKTEKELPLNGTLEFINLRASYRKNSPTILKNLNLKIPQGTKVALVGRTGSGKSTVIQALFRMLHVHSGDIRINGVSLYDFPASETRKIFGIVPQNPWLFAGSLRDNIDVKGEFTNEAIRKVLEELEASHYDLDTKVEEGGQNFSVGERQVFCLARSLLSNQKIIVMDEPTSNIDLKTDAMIQSIIRTKLKGRTLIVIAHRKETISDFEMVVSMDQMTMSNENT